jgi:hypothetical protein
MGGPQMLRLLIISWLLIFSTASHCFAQQAEDLIRLSAANIAAASPKIFAEDILTWVRSEGRSEVAKLQTLGPV